MNYAMIFNGSSHSFPQTVRQMRTFIGANLKNQAEAGLSIILHDEKLNPRDWAGNIFTDRSLWLRLADRNPETALKILPGLTNAFDLILMPSGYFGEELAVRLAFRLKGSFLVSALNCRYLGERLLSEKMVYSQHLKAGFELLKKPFCLALARGIEETDFGAPENSQIIEMDYSLNGNAGFIISQALQQEFDGGGDLATAERLIVAGRGVGGPTGLEKAAELANAIGGQLGVTRPVVMNGWARVNKLVGVSGAMTRPKLSLVFGASGAAAFFAGLAKSGLIISVNSDPGATIIRQSDAAVIDDSLSIMGELLKIIEGQRDD